MIIVCNGNGGQWVEGDEWTVISVRVMGGG